MKRLFKKCKANALKMSKIFLVLVIFAAEVLSPMVVMVNAKELPKMEKGEKIGNVKICTLTHT